MVALTTRSTSGGSNVTVKGSPLTNAEVDANFLNLDAGKTEMLEYANLAAFPVTGNSKNLYVAQDTGTPYRWTGGVYAAMSGAGGYAGKIKTASYAAAKNDYIFADTSVGGFTITLPSTPAVGDMIIIADHAKTFHINALSLSASHNIETSMTGGLNGYSKEYMLMFDGTSWRLFARALSRGLINGTAVRGPSSGVEGTTIELTIQDFSVYESYSVSVSGGSQTRDNARILWTLPPVSGDTVHTLSLTTDGVTYNFTCEVIQVNTIADTSVNITDFTYNTSNDGWSY